jgi:hypothetical protein
MSTASHNPQLNTVLELPAVASAVLTIEFIDYPFGFQR